MSKHRLIVMKNILTKSQSYFTVFFCTESRGPTDIALPGPQAGNETSVPRRSVDLPPTSIL